MERAVYFDGWLKDQYCFHPSMPMRSTLALEDLERFQATMLVWAGLGGGSISLPFLHHEAFGPVDPRLRLYGYMNDAEFIRRCTEKGIKLFGIVFEVQGWEFPAKFGPEGELLALNLTQGEANGWYGLREFSERRHESLFEKKWHDFYPDGLRNSAGEEVTDLLEECAARDYNGAPIHAQWVEQTADGQYCYQMCRNNPVWRDYLKKIIMLQIDAGVAGVQLDESELPITALRHGGCFCRDCRRGFTEYLRTLAAEGRLDARYAGLDLSSFDYADYIRENHIDFPNGKDVPLFREYWEFQLTQVTKYFTELTDFIRSYSRETRGEAVLVSGNFFNGMPVYYPIRHTVDVVTTEMEATLFRQPHWYRYISGFAAGKDVVVAENPYGGIVPQLVRQLNRGEGYDLYRLLLLEATAYGCNMSVPYGGWMGNTMQDAFCPPKEVTREITAYLAANDSRISRESGASVAVLYSWPSAYWIESTKNSTGNLNEDENSILFFTPTNLDDPNTTRLPFWEAIRWMSGQQAVYDVVTLGDGDFVPDDFTAADLDGYSLVVAPECTVLTAGQKRTLYAYAASGRGLLVFGDIAVDDPAFAEQLRTLPDVVFCEDPTGKAEAMARFGAAYTGAAARVPTVRVNKPDLGIHTHRLARGCAVHLINYGYDAQRGRCVPAENIVLSVPATAAPKQVSWHPLGEQIDSPQWAFKDGYITIEIPLLPIYGIAEIISETDEEIKEERP